jgi:two-component system, NtrC family, sensor histidine kinase PilS
VELDDLKALNENIVVSMRGGLLITDLEGQILRVNPYRAEILGRSAGSLQGSQLRELLPGFWAADADPQVGPVASRKEVALSAPGGGTRYIGLSAWPLGAGRNTCDGFAFNFQDLTELKKLEREVQTKGRMAALGRLSAAIAHEIRQPLSAMTGAADAAGRGRPTPGRDREPGIPALEPHHYRLFGLFAGEVLRILVAEYRRHAG